MNVPEFYNLIPYKKTIEILADVVKETTTYEVYKVKGHLVKVMKHIAHSQAVSIYPVMQQYQYKQALKELYKAEKEVMVLDNISEEKKREYRKELNEVRKILIVLNNKSKMEEGQND